jgi:hypothetical protein
LGPGTHIASHRARPSSAYPHADDLLFDLTRVTGAAPLELGYFDGHGGSPEGDANVELRVRGAVSACARVNKLGGREAVISMNWDPWLWKWSSPTTGTQTDPASTLREADELTFYEGQAVMYDQLIQKANKALGANVRVGAVLIDSESFVWPGYPDAIPGMRYWAAVARKNMLMWNATRKLYPAVAAANVSYYSRGGVNWRPDLNATECSRGRGAVRDLDLPRGYCMATDVALDPAFDKRSPFTVTLYQIQEPEYTRQAFLHTAAAAKTFGVVDGAVIPYIALGVGHRRCLTSFPLSPGQVPPHPACWGTDSQYLLPGAGWFDPANTYDYTYSALIGAYINRKQFEASAFGPWEQVTSVILYPPVDTPKGLRSKVIQGSTNTMGATA